MQKRISSANSGFTIVEILVVIVVIGTLAAITIVSYTGIAQKAAIAALQSDLNNASKKLKMYYTLYGSYPTALNASNCPAAPTTDTNYCLPTSGDNTISYVGNINGFCLVETNSSNSIYYKITDNSAPTVGSSLDYGLVTSYSLNSNANDVSGSGANGTVVGPSLTTGQNGSANGAYIFNGTTNYIYLPYSLNVNTATTGYTISTWIYAQAKASAGGWSAILMDWDGGGGGRNSAAFGLSISNGTSPTQIGAWTGGYQGTASTVGTLTTGWHHVVGVWTASATFTPVKMYFDGSYVGNSVTDRLTPWSATVNLGIGTTYVGYDTYFKGSVDDVRVYRRSLSATEIATMYAAGAL